MQNRHDPLGGSTLVAEAKSQITNPQPQAAAPRGGLKKVSLGGIAKKKDDTSNKYPVYPDEDGTAGELAARIAERQDQFDALKSALETDKAELARVKIRPWYLQHFHRKSDVSSSVLVNWKTPADAEAGTPERTGTVRVTVKEQYYSFASEDPFIPILGEQVEKYFRQAFELKIDGDKLPSDKAGELVEKLQQLFDEYGCRDALEAKECIVPVDNFKALRFSEMELAQSLALENVGDKGLTECAVSTKGVRK
jgi:hypothetical protein